MKYKVLNENYIDDILITKKYCYTDRIGKELFEGNKTKIQTKIFTDGIIFKEEILPSESINEFLINKKSYKEVDTLIKKRLYLKDYSYAIKIILVEEWKDIGNLHGWFNVIKNIEIYTKYKKDKDALKKIKKTINMIYENNSNVDYSSIWGVLFPNRTENKKIEYEKKENVYTLVKK